MKSSIKGVAPEWYTLSSEEGEDNPVQFYIQPLNGEGWFDVMMESYDPETGEIGPKGIKKAFQVGVKGWRNIEDGNNPDELLRFSRPAMASLHAGWIMEVGKHVLTISRMSQDASKNSDSSSSSPDT